MLRIVSTKLELRILKTLTSTKNKKRLAKLSSVLNAACFYTPVGAEIYQRVMNVARERSLIIDWQELLHDPALSQPTRKYMQRFRRRPTRNAERLDGLIRQLHNFRRLRAIFGAVDYAHKEFRKDQVDVEKFLTNINSRLTEANTSGESAKWFVHIGQDDLEAQEFARNILNNNTKTSFLPTGIPEFDNDNIGIPRGSYWVLASTTSGGKCLDGSSIVPTNHGLLTLREIYDKRVNFNYSKDGFKPLPATLQIKSHDGKYHRAQAVYRTKGKTWKIVTNFGDTVEGLAEHKLWVVNNKGNFDFIRLDKLREGDFLPKAIGANLFNEKPVFLPTYDIKSISKNCDYVITKIPTIMNKSLAELLGFLVAEGDSYQKITMHDKTMQKRILHRVKQQFGISLKFKHGVLNPRKLLAEFFAQLAGTTNSSHRFVPQEILQSSEKIQTAFLRSLFEGDGSIWYDNNKSCWMIQYTSTSYKLSNTIKAMLENMGIACFINKCYKAAMNTELQRKIPVWNVTIPHNEAALFQNKIGFLSNRKNNRLKLAVKYFASREDAFSGKLNEIPAKDLVIDLLQEVTKNITDKTYQITHKNSYGTGNVTYTKPITLGTIMGNRFPNYFNNRVVSKSGILLSRYFVLQIIATLKQQDTVPELLKNRRIINIIDKLELLLQYKWAKITQVKATNKTKTVYDLYVQSSHSYEVNGIISHNSVVANQVAGNMAKNGFRVCLVQLEMTKLETGQRQMSRINRIDMSKVIDPQLLSRVARRRAERKFMRYHRTIKRRGGLLSIFVPEEDVGIEELLFTLKPMNYDIIIIDYIGLMKGADDQDYPRLLGRVARFGKRFAVINNMVVATCAQLSNENILRYSRAMQEHAQNMWLWNYADQKARDAKIIAIEQPKARNQKNFTFYVGEDFAHMRIKSLNEKTTNQYLDSLKESPTRRKKSAARRGITRENRFAEKSQEKSRRFLDDEDFVTTSRRKT